MYKCIVTHDDFDGIVSAAICSHVFDIQEFKFAGPRTITESKMTVTDEDIVCDLPYPLVCGLWFDHHQGNIEELKYRGIDPKEIEGCFALEPSCSHVVYDYFSRTENPPLYFQEMVQEADVIDSFAYQNIDEWRKETPGKVIDSTLKLRSAERRERIHYMQRLVLRLRNQGLSEVAALPEVQEQYRRFCVEEEQMVDQIRQDATFLPEDKNRELIIIDLTKHNRQPIIVKNLAYLVYPEAQGVVEIKNRFRKELKTNDLSFSMSLSLNLNGVEHDKDVGEIMRIMNIGDGHSGAGAGTVDCKSKDEMLRKKQEIISRIYKIWSDQ